MASEEIILVPGFLGFQRLWDLKYFADTEKLLAAPFRERGTDVHIRTIRTLPTASLGQRAARLAQVVTEIPPARSVHIVGHSTGGLDARLFMSPGVALPTDVDVEAAAARVRSVATVATPHHGTPLATFMTGVHGHRALRLMSLTLSKLLQGGRRSMGGLQELSKAVYLLGTLAGVESEAAKRLGREVIAGLPLTGVPSDHSVEGLLEGLGQDSSLLEQLTPASLELFNNAARDRPGVRYGCVVAMAPRPSVRGRLAVGLHPLGQVSYSLFTILHGLNSSLRARQLNDVSDGQRHIIAAQLGSIPEAADSDGLVPTLSQVRGCIVAAVGCDHLDLMGHFERPNREGVDLLSCGSGFGPAEFAAVWNAVGRFSLDADYKAPRLG